MICFGCLVEEWAMGTQITILGYLVRPGMRFLHRRWLVGLPDGTVRPTICTVTRLHRGIVYYRDESGALTARYPSDFVSDVNRWLQEVA
jgi:hypothetical protein